MKNPPHTKLVGASPIPTTASPTDARAGIQRDKSIDAAGRKVAVVGEAAATRRDSLGGTRATCAGFTA